MTGAYKDAVRVVAAERRGWPVEDAWIFTTNRAGQRHRALRRRVHAAGEWRGHVHADLPRLLPRDPGGGREVIDWKCRSRDGRYVLDFDAL